jgi:hypothetical protein
VIRGGGQHLPLATDCPSRRVPTPAAPHEIRFPARQWHAANVQYCAFFLFLAFLIVGKANRRRRGKSRFDNQLPIAAPVVAGAIALAAQVLLRQARKEAADAE